MHVSCGQGGGNNCSKDLFPKWLGKGGEHSIEKGRDSQTIYPWVKTFQGERPIFLGNFYDPCKSKEKFLKRGLGGVAIM